jgi:hypothetical protein
LKPFANSSENLVVLFVVEIDVKNHYEIRRAAARRGRQRQSAQREF